MADVESKEPIEPHDMLVRAYLADQLDGQLGRAEARFQQFLSQPARPPSPRPNRHFFSDRFRGWTLGIIGTALAASLGMLLAGPSFRNLGPGSRPSGPASPVNTPDSNPILVQQDVQSQTFDDGTVMVDDHTPVRVLRRRDVERTRWFDKNQKLTGEQVVPQDHVIYVRMKTD